MNDRDKNFATKCVVLVPLDRTDAAHHVIEKYELQATIEHVPSLAMAEICLQQLGFKTKQGWVEIAKPAHLVLVHTKCLADIQEMVTAIGKYLPNVLISELRDGRLEDFENVAAIVDELEENPLIHSELVDADELSMLLNPPTSDDTE